jgi:hypothetical protein
MWHEIPPKNNTKKIPITKRILVFWINSINNLKNGYKSILSKLKILMPKVKFFWTIGIFLALICAEGD